MRRLIETETGVYQPLSIKLAGMLPLVLLLVVTMQALAGKTPLSTSFPFVVGLAAMSLLPVLIERRKYGGLGKPTVALAADRLVINVPNDPSASLDVLVANLREIVIYGPEGHRYYRLIQMDNSFVEAIPAWSKTIDDVVIRFLQRKLPASIVLTVKEPQSLFSYIRGDGP